MNRDTIKLVRAASDSIEGVNADWYEDGRLGVLAVRPKALLLVDDAPSELLEAVRLLGLYCSREVQREIEVSLPGALGCRHYLWARPDGGMVVLFGACQFRLLADRWVLDWVWLHPYDRNRGHLTAAWPYFNERLDQPAVAEPLNHAMRGFLAKQRTKELVG